MEEEKLLLVEAQLRFQEEQKVLEEKIWTTMEYLHLTHFETKSTVCVASGRGIY